MLKVNVLGVLIDKVDRDQALRRVEAMIKGGGKHYVVTPNPEFIVAARKDEVFKAVLNKADLAIPDSPRIGWAVSMLKKNTFGRLANFPLFLFPSLKTADSFPTATGVDLMEDLIVLSEDQGFRIGLLGGGKDLAVSLSERLIKNHPKLKIIFADSNLKVSKKGIVEIDTFKTTLTGSKVYSLKPKFKTGVQTLTKLDLDILFVAFGALKQEKWISHNIKKSNTSVMIGVGGAFDYLSGKTPRAPKWIRSIGFEWLFRGIVQPWRIKRFFSLLKFLNLVVFASTKG